MMPKHCIRFATTLIAMFAAGSALACINDRDTLAAEAERDPDMIWTIVGRFDRNPPKYYEMRIARIKAELADKPLQPDLYDDISAAYDRIHQDPQAIEWINQKKSVLHRMGRSEASHPDDWYRTYANEGTFIAHHAMSREPKDLKALAKGRDLIAKALKLNPEAHFGREGTQLAVMNWLLEPEKSRPALAEYLLAHTKDGYGVALDTEQVANGVEGLIRLGAGWQSPIMFGALSDLLYRRGSRDLSALASERATEILGKERRDDILEFAPIGARAMTPETAAHYAKYRAAANRWHGHRVDFMAKQFAVGKHPDTDRGFWDGYHEVEMPPLPKRPLLSRIGLSGGSWLQLSLVAGGLGALILALLIVLARRLRMAT